MELSKRLQAVAALVTVGNRIADIGTDHAYIPIYLIQEKLVPSAVAMDVNAGPLLRAAAHVKENGLEEQISLRLSDGFRELKPFEADTAVIAGMGGGLMIKILTAYPEVTASLKECILQPQSEIAKVRTFLIEEGFLFIEEDMVLEDGKYYPMMKVIPPDHICTDKEKLQDDSVTKEAAFSRQGSDAGWSEAELRYGKLLLEKQHPVLRQFLERESGVCRRILEKLEEQSGERIESRREELQMELNNIRKGLEYYEMQ